MGDSFKLLCSPIQVGSLTLRNRMISTSMGPGHGYITPDGKPTQRLLNFLEERSAGGLAVICQTIAPWRRSTEVRHPLVTGADESDLPELRRMVEAVHKHGGLIVAQPWAVHLWDPGDGRPETTYGPGPKAWREPPYTTMTIEDIQTLRRQLKNCAKLCQEAGFDGVEVMAGVGGILNRFLSLATNDRTDEYGGSLENRARLTLECIRDVKEACGEDYMVFVRWSPVEYVEGGIQNVEDSFAFAKMLDEAGCDLHNLMIGWHETSIPLTTKDIPDGYWSFVSEKIKQQVTKPVATAYRETDPVVMERILEEGKADIIAGLRYVIADPNFARKTCEGRAHQIDRCVGCCRCLDDVLGKGRPLNYCSVNPRLGEELDIPLYGEKCANSGKTVLVAGAGMAGIHAALAASARGHKVKLVEKGPRIGGALVLSSVFSPTYERILGRYADQLAADPNISIQLNTEVTADYVRQENPDAVIVAVGGNAMDLDVPGADGKNVLQSHYILEMVNGHAPKSRGALNRIMYKGASLALPYMYSPALARWALGNFPWPLKKRIAIIGGGLPGCELGREMMHHGRQIDIIDDHKKIGFDVGSSDRFHVLSDFKKADNVRLHPLSTVKSIDEGGVVVVEDGTERRIEADSVVVALGFSPNMALADELGEVVEELYAVGDCADPARMADAVKQGYRAGCRV